MTSVEPIAASVYPDGPFDIGEEKDPTFSPLDRAALDAALPHIDAAPADVGTVALVLRRPASNQREVLATAELNLAEGIVGDSWNQRGSSRTDDGGPHPDMQLNLMNARVAATIAQSPERWALAGDELYVDLDLSEANLPPGTRLRLGTAVIEITDQPHTGCAKFTRRFGLDAYRWVNDEPGMARRLRGVNAKVVEEGTVSPGDPIAKL